MGQSDQDQKRDLLKETALDPNHQHYWAGYKQYKRYALIKCQVCGIIERRNVIRDMIPKGEVPEVK